MVVQKFILQLTKFVIIMIGMRTNVSARNSLSVINIDYDY